MRDQRGQSTPEYVAVVLGVTAVLTAIAVLDVANVARSMSGAVRSAICSILPVDCPAGAGSGGSAAPANPYLPTQPCIRASSSRRVGAKITAFSVGVEGEIEGRRELRSDGTVEVTLRGTGAVGGKIAGGAKAELGTGDVVAGNGRYAEASLMGEASGARSYVFPNQAAANEFISNVKKWAVENAASVGIRSAPGGLGPVADFIYRHAIADHEDLDFPDAEETYFKGGIRLQGKAGVTNPTSYAGVEGALSAGLGGKVNHRTGDVTVFYEVSLAGDGKGGLNVFGGASLGGTGKAVVALTFDASGRPKSLKLTGTAQGRGEVPDFVANWKNLDDISDGLKSAALDVADAGTRTWELEGTLDLQRDPRTRDVALGWLVDHLKGPTSPDFIASSIRLAGELDRNGVITLKEYEGDVSGIQGELAAAKGVTFEIGGGYTHEEASLVSGRYREPGLGFVDIPNCVG